MEHADWLTIDAVFGTSACECLARLGPLIFGGDAQASGATTLCVKQNLRE